MLRCRCGVCNAELIEIGDFDGGEDGEIIVDLECPNCESSVTYYINIEKANNAEIIKDI